jgi:two-component system, cell cycle sensor histidine kinase and response regulator CckA
MAGFPPNPESAPSGVPPDPATAPASGTTTTRRPLKIRILYVEDNPIDVELIRQNLRRGGIDVELVVVDGTRECEAMLEREKFDLVISDFNLPRGDGLEVLAAVRKKVPEMPFILVSGSLGEEMAIEALKQGATDYILKDRLSRIPVAVRRAIEDARGRARARELEAQLIQAQKMEAIGRLAGGVAHDFNNMLTVINGYSELLLGQMAPDDSRRRDLEEIFNAGKRAAGLTRQLLAFSRRQILQPTTLDLNAILQGLERMLSRLIGEDIKLQLRLAPGLHPVNADAGQIEQVIVNLVVNARDAMPQGGKIILETVNADLDAAFVEAQPDLHPGPHALLLVSDTGTGIAPEVKAHLFEPFFTTKERGKGTGLGLSTVLGIVQQCGGSIRVSSELGWGTTFRVYLPRADRSLEPVPPPSAAGDLSQGKETVLIAEDMETVRRLTRVVLESAGYTVLLAKDGTEALSIAEDREEKIHLLLTDMVMKTMSGPELAGLLRRSHPETRILFMSGYTDRALEEMERDSPGAAFIQKPFSVDGLRRRVREVLDLAAGSHR